HMAKSKPRVNFIRQIIDNDLKKGVYTQIHTRFPPEPNGYLHIGHAKSICLNFGIADHFTGTCNLRFDDTNPEKEDQLFVEAIQADVKWLGFDWADNLFHSSDYFDQLYAYAIELIEKDLAYVDSQDAETMRTNRGTLKEVGVDSPYRNRTIEENLTLFAEMKAGKHANGTHILRAKIDMAAPNINLRDPAIYRIKHTAHQRTGDDWCIYPMYDYTHCISDALEGITHSLCTLEFEDHRPLYDWFLDHISIDTHPKQIEFSRLNLDYTVMSKRLLTQMVDDGHVSGWDDPRMPTISGLKRRGYTAASIREFANRIGITKKPNIIEFSSLEACIRDELESSAPRAMAVLDPLKVTITNYSDNGEHELLTAQNHPKDPEMGTREVPFSRTLYIEQDDFMLEPTEQFFRLAPGREVRLRYAYYLTCNEVITNEAGEAIELLCTYDPATKGGKSPDGRKVKATIHWVSAEHAVDAKVNIYDRLFNHPNPLADKQGNFLDHLNPNSLKTLSNAKLEPSLADVSGNDHIQFERLGYFVPDSTDHQSNSPVFNRIVTLRDSWAKLNQ
ncbi:MAG: glutamine--tRNA ligase/YqeY domain fusion protein, partial [Arenicellales bacterium]